MPTPKEKLDAVRAKREAAREVADKLISDSPRLETYEREAIYNLSWGVDTLIDSLVSPDIVESREAALIRAVRRYTACETCVFLNGSVACLSKCGRQNAYSNWKFDYDRFADGGRK